MRVGNERAGEERDDIRDEHLERVAIRSHDANGCLVLVMLLMALAVEQLVVQQSMAAAGRESRSYQTNGHFDSCERSCEARTVVQQSMSATGPRTVDRRAYAVAQLRTTSDRTRSKRALRL